MAALVEECKVQRRLIMEEPSALNKDTAELACSIIPEMATTEQIICTMQRYGVFAAGPQLLRDCVALCTALLEDGTSLALYRRANVLLCPVSVCLKDIYCPVWQSLLDKWTGSLRMENSRCEGDADRLKVYLTRVVVLWTHAMVVQILKSTAMCDVSSHNTSAASRRILVTEYQPGTACLSGQSTAEKELIECGHLQWWVSCLPTDLVGSVASEAATVLRRAAQLWTEEDLQEMVSSDHSLVKMMGDSAKIESSVRSKGCLKLVSVVECSLQAVQQGPATARGTVVRAALSALSYYLSYISETLSKCTWTSSSQQVKLYLVIEASHYIHTRMSDYSNLFEEDGQWNALHSSLLLQAAKLCDSAADGLTRQEVTVFMSYLSHDGESNDWSNPKPFHEGERCSFPVQMLNYQLRGLLHKLEHLAPRRVAAKIACVVLSETLTFMADRYMRVKPSFARTNQLRADLVVLLSMASATLPRLAPLDHTATHYLSVHLERVHHACSRLLTLLALLTSPLDLVVQALQEVAPPSGGGASCPLMPCPSMDWMSWNTGPLQQPLAYLPPTSAASDSSHHLVNTVTHLSQALAPAASMVLHALLYNGLSLCKLLLPAAVVTNTTASRAFTLNLLTLLSHAHNCPKALADAADLTLKSTAGSSTHLLSDILFSSVVGEWLCRHFAPLTLTAQLYDKAMTKLTPKYTSKNELVFLFLEDLESVVVSQEAPVLHLLSAVAEKCSTGVAEVLLALSTNCCREAGEVPTDENDVVDAITSATDESSLWGAVRSWKEKVGQRVEKELHSVSHIKGLSEKEELEAVVTAATSDLQLPLKWMCHTFKANQNALRHALLCPEPTAQPVLLAFSEPEEASALFNPVEEVVRVGGVHLEQDALITHHYDYEGALSASLCGGGWDEVISLVQHRAEFLPDAQPWATIKDEMPVEPAIGLAPSSCRVHACVELACPGNLLSSNVATYVEYSFAICACREIPVASQMAFVPRALKVSRPPAKKAKRPVVPHHVTDKETVVSCESTIASGYPHSESACVRPVYNPAAGGPTEGSGDTGRTSPTDSPGRPASSKEGDATIDEDSDDEPVVSYCKDQRWPLPGEPVCVVCGRYGAYISDATEDDVCSLECKARAMHLKGLPLPAPLQLQQQQGRGEESGGGGAPESASSPPVGCNYREHPDVASLSEEQVDALRTEMKMKVRGDSVPKPVLRFKHCLQQEKVLSNLSSQLGITAPTPVQMQVLPAVLMERDVLVSASTGSGKTLCFLLPLVEKLSHLHASKPAALVLGPVRELCIQTETVAKQLMQGLPNLRTALLVGGLPLANQLHRLKQQVQLLVATPARLIDILSSHGGAVDLSNVRYLVLDEVDSLLQMGFEQQVRQIIEHLPLRRVTMMFSATIPPHVEEMGRELLTDPIYVAVGEPSLPAEGIRHIVLWETEEVKKKRLFTILNDRRIFSPPAVVFVSSRAATLLLAESINKSCNVAAMALHGEMLQERRSAILADFQSGKYALLVATGGLVGRGLDLPHCRQVIVFDFPSSIHEYIHQVGRCARLGSQGTAVTFINESSRGLFLRLVEVLQPTGTVVPPEVLQSHHLQLQRERRASRQAEGRGGDKEHKDVNIHDQSSLMDLIKGKRKRRK